MLTRALAALLALVLSSPSPAGDVLVRGGSVFDAVDGAVRPNTGILVRGGRIASMAGGEQAPPGVELVALGPDDVVLPGIVDLHAHYNIRVCDLGRVDETRHYSVIYLANGVTTTFPAGEYDPEPMLAMRRRIDRGEQVGPRVLNSGPYFGQGMRRNAGAEEVYAQVDEWAAKGARGFKAKRINPVQLQALIERAHAHGLTVTAHLDSGFRNSVNPRDAILMGIDRIEHFLGGDLLPESRTAYASLEHLTPQDLDSPAFDAIVQLYIDHGVAFDATLSAYGYFGSVQTDPVYQQWDDETAYLTPYVRAWLEGKTPNGIDEFAAIYRIKHETVRRFHEAGGTITLGTDHVSTGQYLQGFSAHREMHALVNAGIPEADVLRIATINGARAIGMGDRLGTLEAGKLADMFVIRGNPLEDITRTRTVHTVIKGGDVYRTKALLDSVRGKLGPGGPEGGDAEPAPSVEPVTLSGLRLQPGAGWKAEEPGSSMRVAQYALDGEAGAAALIVYYFGPGSAGSITANIDRWCGQIAQPDGRDTRDVAILKERTVNGMPMHTLDVGGTYVAETRPGSGERVNEPNSHLLAAIVATDAGPYYIKLFGPAKTVEAWRSSYERMLESVEPARMRASDPAVAHPTGGG